MTNKQEHALTSLTYLGTGVILIQKVGEAIEEKSYLPLIGALGLGASLMLKVKKDNEYLDDKMKIEPVNGFWDGLSDGFSKFANSTIGQTLTNAAATIGTSFGSAYLAKEFLMDKPKSNSTPNQSPGTVPGNFQPQQTQQPIIIEKAENNTPLYVGIAAAAALGFVALNRRK